MEYIETIRVEGGELHLLELHQRRLAATMREVYGDTCAVPDLAVTLRTSCDVPCDGLYKCRVVYDNDIRRVEFLPYTPRVVKSLKMVVAPVDLDYHLKSSDRSTLTALSSEKGDFDEVIIVRGGLITDTSYTNLVFKGGAGLYTPKHPLLKGVMRQNLLNCGMVEELDLSYADIAPGNELGITDVILINAMMPLDVAPVVPVSNVFQ